MTPRPWMLVVALLAAGCMEDEPDAADAAPAADADARDDPARDGDRPSTEDDDPPGEPDLEMADAEVPDAEPDEGPAPFDSGLGVDRGMCPDDDVFEAVDWQACREFDARGGQTCDGAPQGLVCEYTARCDREVDPGSVVVCCHAGTWQIIYEDPDPCGLPPDPYLEPDSAVPDAALPDDGS